MGTLILNNSLNETSFLFTLQYFFNVTIYIQSDELIFLMNKYEYS